MDEIIVLAQIKNIDIRGLMKQGWTPKKGIF